MLHQACIQNELSTNESNSNPQNRWGQLIESLTTTQHSDIPLQNHSQYGWDQRGAQDPNQNKSQYGMGQCSRSILHLSGNSHKGLGQRIESTLISVPMFSIHQSFEGPTEVPTKKQSHGPNMLPRHP